jgi:hypothetical protein
MPDLKTILNSGPKDKVKYLRRILDEAKRYRKDKYDDKWEESLKWFIGDQNLRGPGNNSDYRSDFVTNFLFSHVMTGAPSLARRMPVVTVTPFTKEFNVQAKEVNHLLDRIFKHNDFPVRQTESVINGMVFGRGYYKPIWNPRMRGNEGDIYIGVPDTRSVYKDKLWIKDSNWVFECRKLDKLTLYRMYPDRHDQINRAFKAAGQQKHVSAESGENTGEIGFQAYKTSDTNPTKGDTSPSTQAYVWDIASNQDKDEATVEVVEAWFVDETTYEHLIEIEGGKKQRQKIKAFPTGRLITFIGKELLDDRPNPFPAFPYIEWDNYMIPGEIYGHGDLEQLKPIQEQYNIRSNQIADGLNFSTFPIGFYDHTSGLEPEEIENKPGAWYPVDDVKGIHRFDPGNVNAAAFQSLPHLEHIFEVVGGFPEITRGSVPGDVRSGYAVEQLQELAQNRISLKTQNLEHALKNLSSYLVNMIGLFYIPGVHYTDEVNLRGIDADMFDFEVKAGINLPQSKFAQQQNYWKMYEAGVVDEEFMLENSEVPGKEEIKNRMQPLWEAKRNALLNQAASLGQGPPQGG